MCTNPREFLKPKHNMKERRLGPLGKTNKCSNKGNGKHKLTDLGYKSTDLLKTVQNQEGAFKFLYPKS